MPPALRAEEPTAVRPGGVVHWPGADLLWCGMNGKRWDPQGGACWFAVDLLTSAGSLEIARGLGSSSEGAESSTRTETRYVRVEEYPYDVQRIELKDDSTVNLSASNIARSRRESANVSALWASEAPEQFQLPLGAPLANLPEGGRFGSRRFFNGQPRSPHSGADYAAIEGTPVLATADGKVVLAADHFFSGKSVFVDHGAGLISMYFHLSEISVEAGESVSRGAVIGAVGATGRATGPHLHFGLRWRGARVDPALLMQPSSIPALR